MPRKPLYRHPTPGQHHESLDDIEPDARPKRRRKEPAPGQSGTPRRKIAVARRSDEPINPDGGYYYWCDHCDYCNTTEQGRTARCPEHQQVRETNRPRRDSRPASMPTGLPAGSQPVSDDQLRNLLARAAALHRAGYKHEIARNKGNSAEIEKETRAVDRATAALLAAINAMPKPPRRTPGPAPS